MAVAWADLKIPKSDFDVSMLYSALDLQRLERGMTWTAVARAVNRSDERKGGPRD